MKVVAQMRRFRSWFQARIAKHHFEGARTRLPLDEEYWLSVRHPAEVPAAGKALLHEVHPGFAALSAEAQDGVWREFRSYVRQAEGFYRGACALPWQSSPLNHYYSVMNLAKALAVVRGVLPAQPPHASRILRHGLTARVESGSPDKWRLTTRSKDGVFNLLGAITMGSAVPDGADLDARTLLGYMSPIAWQLQKTGLEVSWFPCYWVILVDGDKVWDVLAVVRSAKLDRLPQTFADAYEEVSGDGAKEFARTTLGLVAAEASAYRFLQRIAPVQVENPEAFSIEGLEQALRACTQGAVFPNADGTRHQLCLGLPEQTSQGLTPMTELVAGYALMYFMSSLVRYHPDYLDRIAESADAWLIESFAKSAPLTLLRHLIPEVLGYSLVIEPQ